MIPLIEIESISSSDEENIGLEMNLIDSESLHVSSVVSKKSLKNFLSNDFTKVERFRN